MSLLLMSHTHQCAIALPLMFWPLPLILPVLETPLDETSMIIKHLQTHTGTNTQAHTGTHTQTKASSAACGGSYAAL